MTVQQGQSCKHGMAWQCRAELNLEEAFFTVLQASLHVVKGSATRVGRVCILMCIINLALHNDAMRQQQLPDVRPACTSHSMLDTGQEFIYVQTVRR